MRKIFKFLFKNIHIVLSIFLIVYTIVPFLSPIFFHFGQSRPAWWIQTIYRFLCHQRPERSLFLFGEQLTYTLQDLQEFGRGYAILGYPFVGNSTMGYKVAMCVRDVFIYGAMGATGLFASLRKPAFKIHWLVAVAGVVPMALDGGIQFISELLYLSQERFGLTLAEPFYLSNNVMRAVTGTIFGLAVGLFLFSELREAVQDE